MKVKKPQPMESESKTPAPVLNKTSFKNKAKKEKQPKTVKASGTLTSQLLDAAASSLASATPAERAERLALAKARRAKKRNKNKAASGATPKKTPEKKTKKKKENEAAEEAKPVVPLSQEMRAKIEERKAKKMEKRKRQKEKKLASGGSVKEANVKKLKAKKGPLAAKIDALQEKFSKQREKNIAWKLQKKKNKSGKAPAAAPSVAGTKEEKNKKRNLKKKQRLARRKAEGTVAIFKPRKSRKAKGDKEEAMVE